MPQASDAFTPLTLGESLDEFMAHVDYGSDPRVVLGIVLGCCAVAPAWATAFVSRIRQLVMVDAIDPDLARAALRIAEPEGDHVCQ